MSESLRPLAPVAAAFVLLIGAMWWAFDGYLDRKHNPNRDLRTGPQAAERVVLESGPGGHYAVPGQINGRPVKFLVDTGASHVAVPAALAGDLGLERGRRMQVTTAAGRTTAYDTRIDRIALGGIELRDVRGSINPSMDTDFVLLGMTFLRHLDFRQEGGRLILEPSR